MIYLKIDSIKGNCIEIPFEGHIILDSFQHGLATALTMRPGNTERTTGGPSFSDMAFRKTQDSSSPALYAACAGGTALGTAVVLVTRTEMDKPMSTIKYTLGDAMISSISTQGADGGDLPQESFSINFTSITSQMTQQNADGTPKGIAPFGWDLRACVPLAPPK
ncbi:MAG: Hcp1 family type secretion system effector [Ramlibacter sp.]|jgi:type VI secretion system secreted protein Hcp|nr:Hcp1 family type secretion system effector [Ramlibacter sp.]